MLTFILVLAILLPLLSAQDSNDTLIEAVGELPICAVRIIAFPKDERLTSVA